MTPTDAMVTQAIDGLRRLERQADLGWPDGFDAGRVARKARPFVDVLTAAVEAAPSEAQAMLSAQFVQAVQAPAPFTATVKPKARRTGTPGWRRVETAGEI